MTFKKLLGELSVLSADVLAKSQAGDAADATIQAAGATGGEANDPAAGDSQAQDGDAAKTTAGAVDAGAGGGAGDEGGDEGGDGMAKSFEVTLEDGRTFKAVDAGEMLADLTKSLNALETDAGEALGVCISLIKSQQAQIDQLTAGVKKLGASGSGRQAVLSIVGKSPATGTLAKSDVKTAISPTEFLAKSEVAFDKNAISGQELGLIETMINRGQPIPAGLIQKVASAVSLTASA